VLGLGGGDLGEWMEEMWGETRHEVRLLVSPWASRSIRMNCESLPSAMMGDTVPDPDRELRSVVRSTQDPEKEVGVSDMSLLDHWSVEYNGV